MQCPFSEAGCYANILRKDLSAHMESNTQQHLMKMMTAYSKLNIEHNKLKVELTKLHEEQDKLSSQVAHLTLIEPVKLTDDNSSFTFNIISSQGWSSPPISVLDGYMFSIKHKEGKKASLMLLKGKNDDQLKWPMNLPYKLEIRTEELHRRRVLTIIPAVYLLDNFERVTGACSKEIADINLPERELLNYEMVVRLVPVNILVPTAANYNRPYHSRLVYPDPLHVVDLS